MNRTRVGLNLFDALLTDFNMSNSFLFFLVVVEAVVIIWLASKLSQYKRIDQLLGANNPSPAKNPSASNTPGAEPNQAASLRAAQTTGGQTQGAARATGTAVAGATPAEPEENIEEAKQLQWVMARCQYAEFYLEQLDDDYERGQFKHIIDSCVAKARSISDPFFTANALQSLIRLLDQAGWEQYRDVLVDEVKDDIVRERIVSEITSAEPA